MVIGIENWLLQGNVHLVVGQNIGYFRKVERMGMRLPKKNKVNMQYALQGSEIPIYETDEDGNIRYITYKSELIYPTSYQRPSDGLLSSSGESVKIPVETGNTKIGYDDPKEMKASISYGQSGEADSAEFGFDISNFDAIILTIKGEYPLVVGSLIWTDNEVKRDIDGSVDESSANFRVLAKKTSLNYDKYLLKAVQNG